MNHQNDHERLLADVLAGEDDAGFREALFSETLRLARRRRYFRQARRAAPVVMVVGLALVVWRGLPPQVAPPKAMERSYVLVHSQPLPAAALVMTRTLATYQLVASFTNVQLIQTPRDGGQFREIGDDELLALAEPKPAALVRLGPHTAALIVLSSTDQEAPPPN